MMLEILYNLVDIEEWKSKLRNAPQHHLSLIETEGEAV